MQANIKMEILKNREEWLKNRSKTIGGSEIATVMGLTSQYRSNVDLWEIKTGKRQAEDISDKPYVKYGIEAEEHLRELFKLDFPHLQVEYINNNSFSNSKYPWAKASLDGWLTDEQGRTGVLEIKTTEIMSSQQSSKWEDDNIPQNYYCQILFYMAILEADFAILWTKIKRRIEDMPFSQIKPYLIKREEVEEDIELLMKAGEEFYKFVETNAKPSLILPEI